MACGSSGKDQGCRHYSRKFEEIWALGLRLRNLAAYGHCFIGTLGGYGGLNVGTGALMSDPIRPM